MNDIIILNDILHLQIQHNRFRLNCIESFYLDWFVSFDDFCSVDVFFGVEIVVGALGVRFDRTNCEMGCFDLMFSLVKHERFIKHDSTYFRNCLLRRRSFS